MPFVRSHVADWEQRPGHCYWREQCYESCLPACGSQRPTRGPPWTSGGRSDRPRSWRRSVTPSSTTCRQTPQKCCLSCPDWSPPCQVPAWRSVIWRPPEWSCCAGRGGCDNLDSTHSQLSLSRCVNYSPNNEHRDILNIADTKNRNRIWNLA